MPSDEATFDKVCQEINDVLVKNGMVPVVWAMPVEIIEDDGRRARTILHSDDIRTWDLIGLFRYAELDVAGYVTADEVEHRMEG